MQRRCHDNRRPFSRRSVSPQRHSPSVSHWNELGASVPGRDSSSLRWTPTSRGKVGLVKLLQCETVPTGGTWGVVLFQVTQFLSWRIACAERHLRVAAGLPLLLMRFPCLPSTCRWWKCRLHRGLCGEGPHLDGECVVSTPHPVEWNHLLKVTFTVTGSVSAFVALNCLNLWSVACLLTGEWQDPHFPQCPS